MPKNKFQQIKSKGILAVTMLAVFTFLFASPSFANSGKKLFETNCAACHKVTDQRGVGPGLAGITEKRDAEWLAKWITNSADLIASGDEGAISIFEEYSKSPMPGFPQLAEGDISSIIEYLGSAGEAAVADNGGGAAGIATGGGAEDGEKWEMSEKEKTWAFWTFLIIIVVGGYVFYFARKVKRISEENGVYPEPHAKKDFLTLFVGYLAFTAALVYGVMFALENNIGMLKLLFFGVFPYVAFAIFILGSVYRYTKKGYKVTSLSSQFLEGKKLFWGSQPFHWGLLILFFGHLIAFLFPSAVIAWNGEPVRLLILELSSFAFALSALLGLVLLIKRRLSTGTLLVVTNKMDLVVYTILLTQILSGIGVAFFVRWGSSWFASVLTPYLRSIFSFDPDLGAIVQAPWIVQIHIISAFLLIAIIPFTRFMHFLVAPVDYIWRRYQMVIWNWNRKTIRKTTRYNFGKKPRNH